MDESKRAILLARLAKAREVKKIKGSGGGASTQQPPPQEKAKKELSADTTTNPIKEAEEAEKKAKIQAKVNAEKARIAKEEEEERQRAIQEYIRQRDEAEAQAEEEADAEEEERINRMTKREYAEYMRAKNAGMDGKGLYEDDGMNSSDDDEEGGIDGNGLEGGALSAKELKDLLGASYDPKIDKVGDFVLDSKLSTKTSKVYHNANSGQTVVAHKGTEGILDWGNNAVYALGGKSAYKMTPRYKEAEKVQKKAESKYGAKNVSTIGHSQGGLQAELLGGKSKEIITLNKATRPFESNKNKNQTDVRSGRDVVSALNPFEKKSSKNVEIQGETYNPLAEHSGDVLDRLDENQMIGEGIEGGATYGQRSLSNFFRSRFNPKLIKGADERYINSKLPKDARGNLLYTIMELQALLNEITHSADIFGIAPLNPYTDYKERPTYVDKPRNYVWNARTGATIDPVPTPEEVLGIVQNAYYSLYEDMLDRKGGFKNKQYLFGEKEKTLPSEIGNTYYADWFRTQKVPLAEKEAKEKVRAKPALFISKDITEQLKAKGRKAKTVVAEREKQMKEDAWWIDKNSPKYYPLSKLFDAWLKSVNAVNQAEKDRVERSIDDEMNKLKEDLRMFNEKYGYEKQPAKFNPVVKPVPIPTLTLTQASKSYKWTNPLPKAPEPTLKATAQEFKPKGSGLPTPVVMGGAINFEDMNWGSLTEQMKAYNSQHSKDMDLEGFARMIVADPKSFQKRTLKRARFYLNVLLPKKK